MTRTIVVVAAGLTQPSSTRLLVDQLAAVTQQSLAGQAIDAKIVVIELRELAHDITNHLLTGFPSAALKAAIDEVAESDALITATPIFNASYSGLFKSFFDVIGNESLINKPVLIAATGGTARHSLALEHAMRPMFAHLRALVVPTAVFAATEDWGGSDHRGLAARIDRAADELAELIIRLPKQESVDPYDQPTPFAELLGEL